MLHQSGCNADGVVDGADLSLWQAGLGTARGASRAAGDADGDGDTDGADFLVWQGQVGQLAASALSLPSLAVPEPSTS
ncbi:MAG: dockerin type I domain-containing protein, partial [Bythopirellula sp.]